MALEDENIVNILIEHTFTIQTTKKIYKTSLAIIALAIVAATVVSVYAFAAQDANARCSNGSICQSHRQRSYVNSATIENSDVGNQAASNSIPVGPPA
jgi:hypothetical protein